VGCEKRYFEKNDRCLICCVKKSSSQQLDWEIFEACSKGIKVPLNIKLPTT